jgi:hypothetical protein
VNDPKAKGECKRLTTTMLLVLGAAVLLFPSSPIAAQDAPAGPLPAAQPSDQPPPAPPARSTAPIAGKPNLAGTWKLNTDESDDPMQKMREARSSQGGRRGGWGGGMGGGGVWGGGWGGRNGGNQQAAGGMRGGRGQGVMNDLSQLNIEETPSATKVTSSSGRVLALYSAPSGEGTTNASSPKPESRPPSSNENSANTVPAAQWQGSQLVVTQPTRNGGTTTRTYEMSPDNKQLYVTTKIVNKRMKQPVTFRLVYDPVQARLPGGE